MFTQTDKMVPTTATGDHIIRPHKQIAIHFLFNFCSTSLSLTFSPSPHPSPHAHIHPPKASMAMATSYSSMANPPFTSKTPFPNKQVHSPKQYIYIFCSLLPLCFWPFLLFFFVSQRPLIGCLLQSAIAMALVVCSAWQEEIQESGSKFMLSLETRALAMCLM